MRAEEALRRGRRVVTRLAISGWDRVSRVLPHDPWYSDETLEDVGKRLPVFERPLCEGTPPATLGDVVAWVHEENLPTEHAAHERCRRIFDELMANRPSDDWVKDIQRRHRARRGRDREEVAAQPGTVPPHDRPIAPALPTPEGPDDLRTTPRGSERAAMRVEQGEG